MNENEKIKELLFLINDEIEAIKGYEKVISNISDKEIIEKLEYIRDDEKEHIEILSKLLMNL